MNALLVASLTAVLQAPPSQVQSFEELGLTITLPALTDLTTFGTPNEQWLAGWRGKLDGQQLDVSLRFFARDEHRFLEPDDVNEFIEEMQRDPSKGGVAHFQYDDVSLLPGPFGYAPYASYGHADVEHATEDRIEWSFFALGGVLAGGSYSLQVMSKEALDEAQTKSVLEFLKTGVVYKGPVRDAKWSDADARARWEKSVPDDLAKEMKKITRTAHYIVLSNASGGDLFAKKMEECYATAKKLYPFDEIPGRLLMPVFLFRTPDQYYGFLNKSLGMPLDAARRTKGIATRDLYSTWYEAPNDPVHLHESVHQVFTNRLRLGGGGSWFQEGVAEYAETKPSDRGNAARDVKNGRHTPLAEFVQLKSLIFSTQVDSKKGDTAGDQYKLAALLIEFLRESKWGKDKFQAFVHAVGRVPRNDLDAIQKAVQATYGVDLAGLELQWIEYCKKR